LFIGAAVATGGLSFLAETLARRAAPAGQQPPKEGSGVEEFFKGLFGK
jgi:hypothetical protein